MTRRTALAAFLGFSSSEMNEYLYHAGRTPQAVWAIDQSYFTVGTAKDAAAVGGYLGLDAKAVWTVNDRWAVYQFTN